MPLLHTDHITMNFGGVTAVSELNLVIEENETVAVIGPNGAGKTTCFNMITGVYTPSKGKIFFQDQDITGKRPNIIATKGIARTFQNIRLFKELSVFENIIIAKHMHVKSNFLAATLRIPGLSPYVKEEKALQEDTWILLEKIGLQDAAKEKSSSLPYGQQRKLEIARALATEPKLLLLDEPAAGMNPKECDELVDFINQIKKDYQLTILMIEHHMNLVMEISQRIYVMDFGVNIAKGTPDEIQNDERVIKAYLGVEENA